MQWLYTVYVILTDVVTTGVMMHKTESAANSIQTLADELIRLETMTV